MARKRPVIDLDTYSALDAYAIALNEFYKSLRKAGFSEGVALYLMDNPESMPDWIVGDKGIIPIIPTPDEDED